MVKDELQVLQLEYTSLDDKFRKTQEENRDLVGIHSRLLSTKYSFAYYQC